MNPFEHSAAPHKLSPRAHARAGETIVEVSFALLLVGVWLVTCLAG